MLIVVEMILLSLSLEVLGRSMLILVEVYSISISGSNSIISLAGSIWEKCVNISGSIILLALVEVILLISWEKCVDIGGRNVLARSLAASLICMYSEKYDY